MKKSCVLSRLSDQRLNGSLLGLTIKNNDLTLDDRVFPCCQGSGSCTNLNLDSVSRCDLPKRFRSTKKLINQYYRYWGIKQPLVPQVINRQASASLLTSLKGMLAHEKGRGQLLRVKPYQGPGSLWIAALAASWRLGVACHFVSFGKTPMNELLPREDDMASLKMLFIERVQNLHDPALAFDFEGLIAFAYHANMSVVVELIQEPASPIKAPVPERHPKSFSTKGFFSRKLSTLKGKDPLSFLQQDCLSRLESLCGPIA